MRVKFSYLINIRWKLPLTRIRDLKSAFEALVSVKLICSYNSVEKLFCYIAAFFPTVHSLVGYVDVTRHLTIKRFPAKILWADNSAKSMTSQGIRALLPKMLTASWVLLSQVEIFLRWLYNESRFPRISTLRFPGNKMNCFPWLLT